MRMAVGFVPVLLVLGCGITFPDGAPAIDGEIADIGEHLFLSRSSARKILVKEEPGDPCGIVFSTEGTEIGERGPGGSVEERGFDDLEIGQHVRVWTDVVLDSCPGQAAADAIEIVSG